MVTRHIAAAVVAATLALTPAAVRAQEGPKSPDLAKQLGQLLDQQKLDSIASVDKDNPGTYVAALYFPGTQLLVVSAKYTAPLILDAHLSKKEYRDVYVELSSASIPASKLFVMDTLGDGLVAKPSENDPADSVERAGTTITFDGQWKKSKMSETDYMKTFSEVDAQYAHVLQVLIDKLKSGA